MVDEHSKSILGKTTLKRKRDQLKHPIKPFQQTKSTGIPADIPAGIPVSISADIPTGIPTDVPTSTPADIPTDIPTGIKKQELEKRRYAKSRKKHPGESAFLLKKSSTTVDDALAAAAAIIPMSHAQVVCHNPTGATSSRPSKIRKPCHSAMSAGAHHQIAGHAGNDIPILSPMKVPEDQQSTAIQQSHLSRRIH